LPLQGGDIEKDDRERNAVQEISSLIHISFSPFVISGPAPTKFDAASKLGGDRDVTYSEAQAAMRNSEKWRFKFQLITPLATSACFDYSIGLKTRY
jgi:hypothetical protein